MPFIVQDLIEDNPALVKTKLNEPVKVALARMIEHDFSQLPIVDQDDKPLGLVTAESILRAHISFDIGLDELRVEHARIKPELFRNDSDLFDLLDRLRDTYAVLIVDGNGKLTGIVTNFDTAEYFRRRAEDMMLVEDIESMLRDYIQIAFKDEQGELDESELAEAIQRIADSRQAKKFEDALVHYLSLEKKKVERDSFEQVLNQHYKTDKPSKDFDDLTLNEYEELILDKDRWQAFQSVFNLDIKPIRTLLDKVRDTRNALAHFRGEISLEQRGHLRFTAGWLAQYENVVNRVFETRDESILTAVREQKAEYIVEEEIVPLENEIGPSESRYAPLAIWLENQPPQKNLVKPSFSKIEEIIGGSLPDSAYNHRAWWANDTVSHVQSEQWLDVGWRVSSINMSSQVVRFTRILERQKAYIDFFSLLLAELRQEPSFENIKLSSQGTSYHVIEYISLNRTALASLVFSFGRGKIFRIELYLGHGSKEFNKGLFDQLSMRRELIERSLGKSLLWQRLDKKRASRIAIIYKNRRITDSDSDLAQLRQLAVPTMVKFREILLPQVLELSKDLMPIYQTRAEIETE